MKASIIIPVYNKEQYVEKCLRSALNQTFDDFEVIAVDDGSPDASGRILDRRAEAEKRLRVIHRENGGAAAARNTGLDAARGKYIFFADADDAPPFDVLFSMQFFMSISSKTSSAKSSENALYSARLRSSRTLPFSSHRATICPEILYALRKGMPFFTR